MWWEISKIALLVLGWFALNIGLMLFGDKGKGYTFLDIDIEEEPEDEQR